MGKQLSFDERWELVKRNTSEIIGEDELRALLSGKRKPVVYLGTATTGRPHIGYLVWILKLADLLRAGFSVKVLLADLHAMLDGVSFESLEHRYNYYEAVIPAVVKALGVDPKHMEFVKGSSFELRPNYMQDLLRMSTFVSVHDATKAASEVVKLGDNPKLSGIIYPLMQALDEEYLQVDMQLGGVDQRKIFVLAREQLPKIGYHARVEMMTPLLPGLIGTKMSASDPASKIDFLDDSATVEKKISKAYCLEGEPDNGIMLFLKHILMVIKQDSKKPLVVQRPAKFGGKVSYHTYAQLEKDFIAKSLHPMDLKKVVAQEISALFDTLDVKKLTKLAQKAYG